MKLKLDPGWGWRQRTRAQTIEEKGLRNTLHCNRSSKRRTEDNDTAKKQTNKKPLKAPRGGKWNTGLKFAVMDASLLHFDLF